MKQTARTIVTLILCALLFATTAFASESGTDTADQSDDPRFGTFVAEEDYMIVNPDETFTLINTAKKACIEGQITKEGSAYKFVGDGSAAMDTEASFDGKDWTVGGLQFKQKSIFTSYANETVGDGFVMDKDGMFVAYRDAKNKSGKILGTYERDGWQWIFKSPGLPNGSVTGTFDGKNWTVNGEKYEWKIMSIDFPSFFLRGIYVNDDLTLVLGKSLKTIEESGFSIDADLEKETLKSGELSKEIDITYKAGFGKKALAKVIVINPFENEAPLSDCIACSFYTDDTSKVFSYASGGGNCGQDLFDDLLEKDVYYYTPSRLVYKEHILTFNENTFTIGEDPKGERLLRASGECDLTFDFEGSKLKSFRFTAPDLLYSGLNENVDPDTLAGMDPEDVREAVEERNSILDELGRAVKDAGLNAEIDEQTGEITMDNSILFATSSYELSKEGQDYLDSFMKAYASVLLSDKYVDSVAQIRFEGHTDSRNTYGYNKILSEHRAESVLAYCLSSSGSGLSEKEKERLEKLAFTIGYADADPVFDENGNEDMDASRRVTVKFYIKVK